MGLIWCGGDTWIERNDLPPLPPRKGPYLISDSLASVWNPADGKTYDSKSAYYASVKARGLEIIGGEKPKLDRPETVSKAEVGQDVKRAYDTLAAQAPKAKRRRRST